MIGYTRSNIEALCAAIVPRTPELAQSHGPEHVPGADDVDLADYVIESFDAYQEHHLGPLSVPLRKVGIDTYPFSIIIALLLDFVAIELLVRGGAQERVDRWSLSGPFARLGPEDRLRALELLEDGVLAGLASRLVGPVPMVGAVRFLALGVNAFPLLGYYSEWPGKDPETNPGWAQCDYPGPAPGYSEHMGYAVESFTDDWAEGETASLSGTEPWMPTQYESWPPAEFDPDEWDDEDASRSEAGS